MSREQLDRIAELIEQARNDETRKDQRSVLLTAMFCLAGALRRRSASERHMVWAIVLACASVLPILTGLLPALAAGLRSTGRGGLPRLLRIEHPSRGT
jgi:hypothetical protein